MKYMKSQIRFQLLYLEGAAKEIVTLLAMNLLAYFINP